MGCLCSKSGENSNINLDPVKISQRNINENEVSHKHENINNVNNLHFYYILKKNKVLSKFLEYHWG